MQVRLRTMTTFTRPQGPMGPQLTPQPPTACHLWQARLAEVKRRYFLFPFNTALSLMRVRVRDALRRKDEAAARSGGRR